jgi:hypothetical protein
MFHFEIEMKRWVLFKLCCARKKNNTATFNKLYWIGKKEHNIHYFVNESKKRIVFNHKKRNVDITSDDY